MKPLKVFSIRVDEEMLNQAKQLVDMNEFLRHAIEELMKSKTCPVCKQKVKSKKGK